MRLVKLNPCIGFDTPTALNEELCEKFIQSGCKFVIRYVTRWKSYHEDPTPDIGDWFYGLSKSELETILRSGLKVGIVQAMRMSTTLTYQNGTTVGLAALRNCERLGIPEGATVFCDAEFDRADSQKVISYLKGWQEPVRSKYRPGLYVGYDGLTGEQLYSLPGFACYWRAGMRYVKDPQPRGYAMWQTGQQDVYGIDVDFDYMRYDEKGDRPYFVSAD
jgi:hypothetical protein